MKRTRVHAWASCVWVGCLLAHPSQAREPVPSAGAHAGEPAKPALGSDGAAASASGAAPAAEPLLRPLDVASELDPTERAKRLYALGAEAFAARQNADAIRYFRRAAALVPSSKLTYNIALAYSEMGDAGRALSEYRAYLRQEQGAEARADVSDRMRELERKLAANGVQQLSVSSRPPGATLRVGTQAVGVTPWAGELTPGVYEIRLDLPGYPPSRRRVTLARDASSDLDVELSARDRQDLPVAGNSRHITPLTWSFLGVGVGAVGGGIGFELSRASSSERAGRASSPLAAAEARGAADAKQMSSLLLLGFGGGFLIAGGVLLVLDLSERSDGSSARPAPPLEAHIGLPCSADFCGVLSQGHF
jgi:hypothetical protein